MKKYEAEFRENFEPINTVLHDVVIDSQPHSTTQPITDRIQPCPDTSQHNQDTSQHNPDTIQHNLHNPVDIMETLPVSMAQNTNFVPSEPPPNYNEAVTMQPSQTII